MKIQFETHRIAFKLSLNFRLLPSLKRKQAEKELMKKLITDRETAVAATLSQIMEGIMHQNGNGVSR